jgi:hypothetical protein
MPRRKTPSDESKRKQGRGQGDGKDYVPFDKVREVPSMGLGHRSKGNTTGRVHETLSTLEHNIKCILDSFESIVDIKEQFPLPLDETIHIAERLSIKHPTDPYTHELWQIRLDFLITYIIDDDSKQIAISAKYAKALESKRTIEKLEIERTYFAEIGIDWKITTENEVLDGLIHNVKWIRTAGNIEYMPDVRKDDLEYLENALLREFADNPGTSLSQACIIVDQKLGLKSATALWLVKHFIFTQRWHIDMLKKIDTSKPLSILSKKQDVIEGNDHE